MRIPVALLLPFLLAAQPPPDSLCSLSGQVVNAITAEPVRRALLTLRRIDSSPAVTNIRVTNAITTDAAGRFAIAGIEPGTYRLSAERSGFLAAQYGSRGPGKAGTPLVLTGGQKSGDLLLSLYPHSIISGRVLDEEGEPMPTVDVHVSRLQYMQGHKQFARTGNAITNDLGEYRVFGLAPGRYYVNAVNRPNPNASDAAALAGEGEYVSTYYPHTTDPAAAAPLDVTPGSQLGKIDVTLARVRTVSVKGRVINEATAPPPAAGTTASRPNLNVMLSPQNPLGTGGGNGGALVSPEGTFEFRNVVPGAYLLVALANFPGKAYTARVPLQIGAANVERVAITIHAPVTVAGQVKVDGDSTETLSRIRIGLQPFEVNANTFYGQMPDVALNSDGTFLLPDVSAEHFRVYLNALPDGFYVKSMRAANVDVQAAGLDLGAGAPVPLVIVLSPNAGQVSGTVLDPKTRKPVSAVTAVLVPQEKERRDRESFYKTTITDQAGHFTFKNLVPGDYKVFCWEDVPFGSWMDPDFLAPHESRGEPVAVREGSPQSIQVNLVVD